MARQKKSQSSKIKENTPVNAKKTVNSRVDQAINWHLVVCPKCGQSKFDSLDLNDDLQWKLLCKNCSTEWTENLKTPKKHIPKASKAQKAAFQKLYDQTKQKLTEKKERKRRASSKRKPHHTRPTPDEEDLTEERRDLVWELYKMKYTVREISKHLESIKTADGKQKFPCSVGTVSEDLQKIRQLRQLIKATDIAQEIDDEIAILDEIHRSYYPILKRKSNNSNYSNEAKNDAAHFILMASDRRCKLKNLYKPLKIVIEDDRDFAAQLGIEPEDLPDAENES